MDWRKTIGAAVLAASMPLAASASPDVPPAPYKPLPVGTVLDYGSWKCKVVESTGYETVCADGAKRARFYGKFVLNGRLDREQYGGALSEEYCGPTDTPQGEYIVVDSLNLSMAEKRKIREFWPLRVGKSLSVTLTGSDNSRQTVELTLVVRGVERLTVIDKQELAFRIDAAVEYKICQGLWSAYNSTFIQSWWYNPRNGVIVKSSLEPESATEYQNYSSYEYTLLRHSLPPAKPIAGMPGGTATGPGDTVFDMTFWGSINNSAYAADFKAYLRKFPDGNFADLARNRLAELSAKAAIPAASRAPDGRASLAGLRFGRYHALVIGNNAYRNLPALKTAVHDAEAVARRLKDDYGFDAELLVNATRADVIDALARYRARLTERDNLLVYYAGHGVIDDVTRQGYWLPVDARTETPSNWVSVHDVTLMLHAIQARHVMVVSDSCYSGTLVRSAPAKLATATDRTAWIKRMLDKRARTALTSGGLEPVVDDGGGGHSVFAKAFLAALDDNDGVLEGQRLFDRIKRPVALNSDQTPQYSDIRLAGHEGGDFMFVKRRR